MMKKPSVLIGLLALLLYVLDVPVYPKPGQPVVVPPAETETEKSENEKMMDRIFCDMTSSAWEGIPNDFSRRHDCY